MNAWEALARTPECDPDAPVEVAADAPFEIILPAVTATPLVFASPHSGRIYPTGMMSASRLDADAIRRSEDVWVDQLIEGAPELASASSPPAWRASTWM
jgi:N-formylglutamate amidohydrolase